MKRKNIINIIQIILIIIFMISIVPKEFQNDTFFTIALGERTVKYGIETIDQLVWHDNLEFIHLRWLFDVVIYMIYNFFDLLGIAIFVIGIAIIQALMYYHILKKLTGKSTLAFVYTIFIMYITSNEFTGRAQIISFTLFLIEFFCIEMLIKTDKKRYFIGLLIIPILLVNFHASVFPVYFVFFLPYIVEYFLSKLKLKDEENGKLIIETYKIKKLVILMLIGVILGFCSPIGIKAYLYMFNVMNDGVSSLFISELQSLNVINNISFLTLWIITFSLLIFTKTKIKVTDAFFILGFGLLSMATVRCIFFFYLISSICVFRTFCNCIDCYEVNIDFLGQKCKNFLFICFVIFILISSSTKMLQNLNKDFINTQSYPIDATNYILNNVDIANMKIFNHFNFGSYLELNGIKVFLDSRSEMYTSKFNKDCDILLDWYNVSDGKVSYKEIFDKYEITHALLYNIELINMYICDDTEWKLLYQDDSFSLYERITQ